jgi:hypothetical protein
MKPCLGIRCSEDGVVMLLPGAPLYWHRQVVGQAFGYNYPIISLNNRYFVQTVLWTITVATTKTHVFVQ